MLLFLPWAREMLGWKGFFFLHFHVGIEEKKMDLFCCFQSMPRVIKRLGFIFFKLKKTMHCLSLHGTVHLSLSLSLYDNLFCIISCLLSFIFSFFVYYLFFLYFIIMIIFFSHLYGPWAYFVDVLIAHTLLFMFIPLLWFIYLFYCFLSLNFILSFILLHLF